jgi:DUF4097 and DUF4098 domain-containing protein YvlB
LLFPLDGPSVQSKISLTTTEIEAKVGASTYDDRKVITIQPVNGTIRMTFQQGTDGFYLFQGGMYSYEASASQKVYIKTDTGTVDVIISERS